nr:transketolase C-terminal domain-containing protein [Coxiella burnetii]
MANTAIVAEESYRYIQQTRKVIEGTDITVVAMSYMTIEALHAVKFLKAQGIHCELIDLRTIKSYRRHRYHGSCDVLHDYRSAARRKVFKSSRHPL